MKLAQSYQSARNNFLSLCKDKALYVESHIMPGAVGINGEELAMDVAHFGSLNADRCLLVSSAVHGIEGYCGSAVQCALLESDFLEQVPENTAVVLVHGVNPYGFSFGRRVNEDNVDVNRNFLNFSNSIAKNEKFLSLAEKIFPESWQGSDLELIHEKVSQFVGENGQEAFQAALMGGQHDRPDCTFYGGTRDSWSKEQWLDLSVSISNRYKFVVHLDIHTGLGAPAQCEVIYAGSPEEVGVTMAGAWFGADKVCVPGSSASNAEAIFGNLGQHLGQEGVGNVSVALEFGTQALDKVAAALINDNWLGLNPGCDDQLKREISANLRAAFATDTPEWEAAVWQQALQHCHNAINGIKKLNL